MRGDGGSEPKFLKGPCGRATNGPGPECEAEGVPIRCNQWLHGEARVFRIESGLIHSNGCGSQKCTQNNP